MSVNVRFETQFIEREGIRLKKTLRHVGMRVLAIAGVSSALLSAHNIIANQQIAEEASSSIHEILPARTTAGEDRAIVMFDGFGTIDADALSLSLGPDIQRQLDGSVISVRYGNALLNTDSIAKQIETYVEHDHKTELDMVGYSAGGDIMAAVNTRLEHDHVATEALYFISTPDGLDGLRPDMQTKAVPVTQAIAKVPPLEYSDPVRFGVEMVARSHLYTDQPDIFSTIGAAAHTASHIIEQLSTKQEIPGSWMLVDQLFAIQNANIKDRFNEIATASPDIRRPAVVYLGTGKDGYDTVVNDKWSARHFADAARSAGLGIAVDYVPDAVHAEYQLTPGQYRHTFQQIGAQVRAMIEAETVRLASINDAVQ